MNTQQQSPTVALACQLIRCPSLTPADAGCQQILAARLAAIGFHCEHLRFGKVDNLWARRGKSAPLFAFAGHTDVVPTGAESDWRHPPFAATICDHTLFGRGAADMKGGIAAMVTATERFVRQHPDHNGSIAFLITSDEEGPATDGTVKVIETLQARGEKIDWCLVGEPSSGKRLGDTIKNGRRGSLNGDLTVAGKQGHVAYPHLADNPIHKVAGALAELCTTHWDDGNDHFPPTSFQVSNLHAGTGVGNVIPGTLHCLFNFRFSTANSAEKLIERCTAILQKHAVTAHLQWQESGRPFLTDAAELTATAQAAVQAITGTRAALSTGGGTSDGRFIAPTGAQVIELGLRNDTIHQCNECTSIDDLNHLADIYTAILCRLPGLRNH